MLCNNKIHGVSTKYKLIILDVSPSKREKNLNSTMADNVYKKSRISRYDVTHLT